ncbi:hypothetical protein RND81_09G060100 [Saponaria officinalis]|uniref:Viral late gene transcription factor 3 zinc ribbon domain-containing protein n=1 Tax=Saponaria officinalis TaxID=3572 RepID=A0AAW1IH54_SAPOF
MKGLLSPTAYYTQPHPDSFVSSTPKHDPKSTRHTYTTVSFVNSYKRREMKTKLNAVSLSDVSTSVDPVQAQLTWQIVVGSLAGVIPFIVAGIEFNKRIVAQRRCEVCGGSGLVLRDKKYYFRCPACGGFLPWQSWKRFFSG